MSDAARFAVGVVLPPATGADDALRRALVEDTYEVVAALELVRPALVVTPGDERLAGELAWPGTLVVPVDDPRRVRTAAGAAAAAFEAASGHPPEAVALTVADAPDLPGLLLGKAFRALGSAGAAMVPCAGGGVVALATRVPPPAWLPDGHLDDPQLPADLVAAAPERRALATAPGWHRVRTRAEAAVLDPSLEGWAATRALLSR